MVFLILFSIALIAARGSAQDDQRPVGSICLISSQDVDSRSATRKARIIGGRAARDNEFPWQVSVRRRGRHICGGSLIHEEWVITAAHCIRGKNPSEYLVEAGFVFEGDSHKQISGVEKLFPHAQFQGHKNDIGLIKLTKAFRLDSATASVCLPNPSYRVTTGGIVVSGWGVTDEGSFTPSNALRVITVPVITNQECSTDYSTFWTFFMGSNLDPESMFCAGFQEGGKDSCQGDSGGPAIQFIDEIPTLVGIVSWGKGCARARKPGVYTETAFFVGWALEVIRDYYGSLSAD